MLYQSAILNLRVAQGWTTPPTTPPLSLDKGLTYFRNSGYPPGFLVLQILHQLSKKVLGKTSAYFKAIFCDFVEGLGMSVQVILTTTGTVVSCGSQNYSASCSGDTVIINE